MLGSFTSALESLLTLQEAVDRSMRAGSGSGRLFPPVNLFEREGDLMLVSELPGVNKDDIKIEIQNNQLRLKGERKIDYGQEVSVHRTERKPGVFDRSFRLPFNVEVDQIKAECHNGLLVLHMPRAEADRPRQISLN